MNVAAGEQVDVREEKPAGCSFEDLLTRLEGAVQQLESGGLNLDQALRTVEEGMRCYRLCRAMLNEAEGRVAELFTVGEGDGG
ncbi:MAG: exodeoxyribonuclease VII small subunit [Negativicutes bacterium]|nr:exodeoxyribonuclease VII small subunit [Negativicutes bacterium]